jgi:hypothetical protein
LVESTLALFSIDTSSLTRQQRYDSALQRIHTQASQFRTTAIVVVIIAVLAAGVTTVALWREKTNQGDQNTNSNSSQIPYSNTDPKAIEPVAVNADEAKVEGIGLNKLKEVIFKGEPIAFEVSADGKTTLLKGLRAHGVTSTAMTQQLIFIFEDKKTVVKLDVELHP